MIAWCILQSIYYSIVSKYNCDKYPLSHKRKQEKMQKKCSIEKDVILAFYFFIAVPISKTIHIQLTQN